jgi:hypothetical protein
MSLARRALEALAPHAYPLGLAAATFATASGYATGDPDTYWHLASGQWMLDHRELLRNDIFSSTVAGKPYALGEWLGEIVLTLVFNLGGWSALTVFRALLAGLASFFLGRVSRAMGAPLVAALVVVVWAVALAKTRWTDRPAIFGVVLFIVVLDLLFRSRAGSRWALVAIPPVVLLWANLHGSYPLGIGLVLAFTLEALLERRPEARRLLLALGACVVLSFLDPDTLGIGGAASHAFTPPRFISEEVPPDVLTPPGLIFAAFVLASLALALVVGGVLLEGLLVVPLLWLGLSAQRQLVFFIFAATPFIAASLAQLRLGRLRAPRPWPPVAAGAMAAVLCVIALASLVAVPPAPDETGYPTGALAALRAGSGTLLNEYDWGGYLIYRAPERKVFVDGRLFPYLPQVLADWDNAVQLRPDWREVLRRYDVAEVLLRPSRPLVIALREEGWPVRAEGNNFVLLARP